MPFFFVPEHITFTFDVSPALTSLVDKIIAQVQQPAKLSALTQRLQASNAALQAVIAAHPDPDSTD